MNTRSIVNKMDLFQNYVYSNSPDIIAVTETWLSEKIFDNEILPNNYTIIRKDRKTLGGGVMFAVKSSKPYQVLQSPTNLEMLTISIGSTLPTVYCLGYIPPDSSVDYCQEFLSYINTLRDLTGHLILLGDFNLGDINWDSLCGQSPFSSNFCDVVFDLNLVQMIDEPTHIAGNILDLVLTNAPDNILNLRIHCDPPLPIPSDHFVITFDSHSSLNNDSDQRATPILNYSKGNYNDLCYFLYNSDFTPCLMSEDIEFVWSYLSNTIKDALPHFIPITTIKPNSQPVWFNSDIRHHINCLRSLRRKFNNNSTEYNKNKLETSQNLLQAKISNAKMTYESNLVTTSDNSKIYKYIRGFTKSKSIPSTMYHNFTTFDCDNDKANAFNNYFYSIFNNTSTDLPPSFNSYCPASLCHITITEADVYEALVSLDTSKAMGPDGIPPILLSKCASVLYKPLHYLFNLTLKFGYLPCEWKVHKIIPVFKSGDPTHINNYRPISLLSNTSKVLERILHDKIIGHVTSRINPAQFGFIQNHSSVQQLLLVLSDIFTSRHQLDIIYLDITKAFDTISHSHLLHKLRMFDIGGELWSWFLAYVTNRSQFVSINGCNSNRDPPIMLIILPIMLCCTAQNFTYYA